MAQESPFIQNVTRTLNAAGVPLPLFDLAKEVLEAVETLRVLTAPAHEQC